MIFFIFIAKLIAENYALVIGGKSSMNETRHHEFARPVITTSLGLIDKGYKVTTLMGSDIDTSEKERFLADYQKLSTIQKNNYIEGSTSSSKSNIDRVFRDMIDKVKAGDKIEILIAAHGIDSCAMAKPPVYDDLNPNCTHSFQVYENGEIVEYESSKIIKYLKELEDKGALPTLIMESCFSGRNKASLNQLSNSCVFLSASGNESAFACFEDDPDFSLDHTSTTEYISMRYYRDIIDTLKDDSYFKDSTCLPKILDHASTYTLDTNTVASAYLNGRRYDSTEEFPTISSLLNFDYFTTGKQIQANFFAPTIYGPIDCSQVISESGLRKITNLEDVAIKILLNNYYDEIKKYNQLVISRKEKPSSNAKKSEGLDNAVKLYGQGLQPTQIEGLKIQGRKVIEAERILIDSIFRDKVKQNDPCRRSL